MVKEMMELGVGRMLVVTAVVMMMVTTATVMEV